MADHTARLRTLPSVDRVLGTPAARDTLARFQRQYVADAIRAVLAEWRGRLAAGTADPVPSPEAVMATAVARMDAAEPRGMRSVVNATGVGLHTNLGRAVLAREAIAAVAAVAASAVDLELDLAHGGRGAREDVVRDDLCHLTGAEACTVVNNNAAAVLLALNTLAEGREVIVSRGELIEIGGSFRLPDVMAKSGARLREIGTTNRTHPRDYRDAITTQTALLLKVHTSNYRVVGFTSQVGLAELVELGRAQNVAVMEDLGSGALVDLSAYGLPKEPVVAERVRLGADVVTFSGDKLLGGPQAGILVGRREYIARLDANPLKRALRCDKLTLAALAATLRLYSTAPDLRRALPTLRWLSRPIAEMEAIAAAAVPLLCAALGPAYVVECMEAEAEIGSGALPLETLPSLALSVTHPQQPPQEIAARFRCADPPILGRVHGGRFLLDLRGIFDAAVLVPGGVSAACIRGIEI